MVWLAGAVAVRSRLWLGGVVGVRRDGGLIRALLTRARACGPTRALLLCTDGLASSPTAARRVLREAVRTGRRGRPRLVLPAGVLLAQCVKRRAKRRVVAVERRVVRGTAAAVAARLVATQGAATAVVNTAYVEYVERPNATFDEDVFDRLVQLATDTFGLEGIEAREFAATVLGFSHVPIEWLPEDVIQRWEAHLAEVRRWLESAVEPASRR